MKRKTRVLVRAVTAMVVTLLLLDAIGQTVTLAWDPSPSAGIAHYQVHYGTNSGVYPFVTNAGLALTQTVILPHRGRWYFAATAWDTNNFESAFSNEVEWEVKPGPPMMHSEALVRITPVLLRSTNLVGWSAVCAEPTFFAATNAAEFFRVSGLTIEHVKGVK